MKNGWVVVFCALSDELVVGGSVGNLLKRMAMLTGRFEHGEVKSAGEQRSVRSCWFQRQQVCFS